MSEAEKKSRTGLFSKKKALPVEEIEKSNMKGYDSPAEENVPAAPIVGETPPVSFISLFRLLNLLTLLVAFVHNFVGSRRGSSFSWTLLDSYAPPVQEQLRCAK